MVVEEINSSNFRQKILKGRSLVDYWAEWCGPCRMMAPVFEELSKDVKDVKFFRLNVDENGDVAAQSEVQGIPTLILFKDGKEIKRIVGLRSKEDLKRELK
ncbi:MAG: Thioredoxin [Berkelbacteria bacterium GW2011_GWA1_36_9]|uniref:Thioredoxin n=1 Tax=Berkelbacteria bacterium GW2011_GWA1_36_9 TaxID=1618331 RepID=A0A0G0FV10_9BACT|nr:MAG: Thioredoxin [Berkelbacteria bacterium GW2011_GWA1_36_9]